MLGKVLAAGDRRCGVRRTEPGRLGRRSVPRDPAARGADAFPSTTVLRTLALSLLVLGLWALIGLGAGILIPNQVAALLIGVGVAWIVEPILGAGDQGVRLRPASTSRRTSRARPRNAIINVTQASPDDVRLSWWGGALTLAAWAAAFAGAGILRVGRQDIS